MNSKSFHVILDVFLKVATEWAIIAVEVLDILVSSQDVSPKYVRDFATMRASSAIGVSFFHVLLTGFILMSAFIKLLLIDVVAF